MLSIIKATDNSIKLNFTENGEPLDITDYSILFTVKAECKIGKDDDEALITKNITVHSDPEEGESTLNLSSEDTDIPAGNYYWDLRLIKDGVITQTKRDTIEVVEGITKRTS